MQVEIWSDVVCPWCYIGKRNFEQALADFEHRDEVEVVWRSFELDPNAPPVREGDYQGRIARKYGVPPEHAQMMIDRITGAGAEAGIEFRFDMVRPGNTFDAHRLIHLASDRGVQGVVKERLLAAYCTEGEAIGQRDTLVRLAVDAGLDESDVVAVLDSDKYAADVRADEEEAHELGCTGVPFFVIDRAYGIPGAQPPETLLRVLERRWEKFYAAPKLEMTGDADAPNSDGDSCDI